MADLVFGRPLLPGSPTHLVFGAEDDAPAILPVEVEVYAELGGVVVTAFAVLRIEVGVLADLAGVEVACSVKYDNLVTHWLEGLVRSPQQLATFKGSDIGSVWQLSQQARPQFATPWTRANAVQSGLTAINETALQVVSVRAQPYDNGQTIERVIGLGHDTGIPVRQTAQSSWQVGDRREAQSTSGMQTGVPIQMELANSAWQWARPFSNVWVSRFGASRYRVGVQASEMPWQAGRKPPNGMQPWPPVNPRPEPFVGDPHLVFQCPPIIGSPTFLVFGERPCYPPVNPGETVIVPIRRVYIVLNEVSLRRVDGNIELPASSMALNLDRQSWTWGFSASLPGRALADLEPASLGVPVELEAMINGTAYRFLVDEPARDREFGKSSLQVQGRGKSSLLDSPFAPVQSFGNSTDRTAQQLMGDILTLNGVPMNWALDWLLEDWIVPAGVFMHQGSYISALNAIAGAAGGYIQPHPSLQRFSVMLGYPVVPWNWHTVVPDFELPADVTTRENIKWTELARYNRVYVGGQQAGGLGQVTRTGTAGDVLAPMVTDALITAPAAARQRGMGVLGNTGRKAALTLRTPVLPETGVIPPGKFVRYVDEGIIRIGLTRSVTVESSFPEVWQNIGVETHVN